MEDADLPRSAILRIHRQDRACPRRIGSDLRLERLEAGEFLLRPDVVDEGDAEMAAIEIAGESEEMDLEREIAAAEGRAHAEIGDAVVPAVAAADGGAHRIDAAGGAQVIGELDMGGRDADRAAAPIALLDPAIDLPGAGEERRRIARPAFDEKMADARRRVNFAIALHRLDDGDAEAESLAHPAQQRRIAAAAVAEDEVVTDDGLANAEPGDKHVAHEILRAQRSEFEVEMQIVEEVGAETAQQFGLDAKRRQAKGRQPGLKDTARMRLEGQDTLLHAGRARELAGLADDELVTEMDAVEIADRDRAATRASRKPGVMAKDIHRLLDY